MTARSDPAVKIGPGRFVLVVGPSGAGKDTLIDLARTTFRNNDRIVFPRRVVTREASASERNECMSREEFDAALARGEFAVSWIAHGHCYALRSSIDAEIANGRIVVANVSRTVVSELRKAYRHVLVVEVTAPVEILRERLARRGRSSDGDVETRLQRANPQTIVEPDMVVNNVGLAADRADELCSVIRSLTAETGS